MPGRETAPWAEFVEHLVREQYGGKQMTFARALGINQGTVSRWMSGQSLPDVPSLVRISELHHQSLLELLAIAYQIDMERLIGPPVDGEPETAGNAVEDAISRTVRLRDDARGHFLNQYQLLKELTELWRRLQELEGGDQHGVD